MNIKTYPVSLDFPYEYEYSIDDGATWTTVNANTRTNIPGADLPASKMVKVRSSSASATTFNADYVGARERVLHSVNIKNGSELTTLYQAFKDTAIDKVQILNVDKVESADGAFYRSDASQVNIASMPLCTNFTNTFAYANIKELSNIRGSRSAATNFYYTFRGCNINLLGEVFFPTDSGPVANTMNHMFWNSTIELFPNCDIVTQASSSSSDFDKMFQYLKTAYMLTNELKTTEYRQYSPVTHNGIFQYTNMNFCGADIKVNSSSERGNTVTLFSNNPKLTSFSSRYVSMSTSYEINEYAFTSTPLLDSSKYEHLRIPARADIIEDPQWFPEILELGTYSSALVMNSGILSTVNNRIVIIDNGTKRVAKWAETHHSDIQMNEPVSHAYTSDYIWFSRNGRYAVVDGTDVKIYENDDTVLSTIANFNPTLGAMDADGDQFHFVNGSPLDKTSDANQTVNQSIRTYDSTTGVLVNTEYITTLQNEEIDGVYKRASDGRLNVLVSKYSDDLQGGLELTSSRIISIKDGDKISYSLSISADKIAPNFAESAEFVVINTTSSLAVRMISK